MFRMVLYAIFCILISACDMGRIGYITSNKILTASPVVTSVRIQNDQFIISGQNLQDVTEAKIEGSTNHTFDIESKTQTELVLNAKSALALLAAGTFDFLISNASGAATFPVTFDLTNGQVTAAKLNNMGATSGQVLRFNGTNWAPGSISSSQIYTGTYDALTNTPDIYANGGPAGTFYIVNVAGTQALGGAPITFAIGDWAIFDGTNWSKVPLSGNTVTSFNGRTGVVVPLANDYTWSMLHKTSGQLTGSKLSDIADVDVTGLGDGYVLKWLTNKWIVAPEAAPSSGSTSTSVPATGGGAYTVTQTSTAAASAERSTLIVRNNGTGGANEYNIVGKNAAGANTFSVDQAGFGSFASGLSVGGNINSATLVTPLIYGSTIASENLTIDSTSHATKGHVLISPTGGRVGIGTTSPLSEVHVSASGQTQVLIDSPSGATNRFPSLTVRNWIDGGTTGQALLNLQNSRGNSTTSAPLNSGDTLGLIQFLGIYDTANTNYGGAIIRSQTEQAWTGTNRGTNISFTTTSLNQSSRTEKMRISADGNVGIGTPTPSAKLEVSGDTSKAYWGTNGVRFKAGTATFTDTASSGVLPANYVDVIKRPTLAASSATTYSRAATLAIEDSPLAGTNVTLPTPISLHVTNSAVGTPSTQSYAVYAQATNGSQYTTAIKGYSSGNGYGVEAEITGATGAAILARAPYNSILAYSGNGGTAIRGETTPNSGTGDGVGVYAGLTGTTNVGYGLQVVNNSATGWGVYSSGTSRNYFNGNVGIKVTDPSQALQVAGNIVPEANGTRNLGSSSLGFFGAYVNYISTTSGSTMTINGGTHNWQINSAQRMTLDSSGNLGIGVSSLTEKLEVNGSVKATSFITSSDRRLKFDIEKMTGIDLIKKLTGVKYKLKALGTRELGLIAQDVEKVLPEAVVTDKSGMKGVKYQSLISPMIEAIKDNHEEIAELRKQNANLQKQIDELKMLILKQAK